MEYADVFLLLLNAAFLAGFDVQAGRSLFRGHRAESFCQTPSLGREPWVQGKYEV
jgi:hypothetical protein